MWRGAAMQCSAVLQLCSSSRTLQCCGGAVLQADSKVGSFFVKLTFDIGSYSNYSSLIHDRYCRL